jgi:hypothetical protein
MNEGGKLVAVCGGNRFPWNMFCSAKINHPLENVPFLFCVEDNSLFTDFISNSL